MMRQLILGCAVVIGVCAASPARAGEVCNETSFMIEAAKAWRTATGLSVEGWVQIAPGGCAPVGPDVETEQYLYARSTAAYPGGVREWRGGLEVCVDETDFSFEGVADCAALGLEARMFRRLTEDERDRAVLVELEDFRERADEAGLQRLLQAAGYDIRMIDGYAGRRTRRQVEQFQSDAGASFDTDRDGLVQALHTAALARNRNAGLQVCNQAGTLVAAATARATGDGYQSTGWWRIEPGGCAHVLSERLTAGEVFVYARLMGDGAPLSITDGGEAFCVAAGRFTTQERTDCRAIGFESALFRPAPEPQDGGAELVLTRADFEEDQP